MQFWQWIAPYLVPTLIVVVSFSMEYASLYVSAKISLSEKDLQHSRAMWWTGLSKILDWIDYIIFILLVLKDDSLVRAIFLCAIPGTLGAMLGERRSVQSEQIQARIKRLAKNKRDRERRAAKRLAAGLPPEPDEPEEDDEPAVD